MDGRALRNDREVSVILTGQEMPRVSIYDLRDRKKPNYLDLFSGKWTFFGSPFDLLRARNLCSIEMKIISAAFIRSAFDRKDWVDGDKPDIAFLGRSNVGKSSLINSLLSRKNLARTSNTPGRTQSINFFLINERFYFVDLPGYGFARVPRSIRESWGTLVEEYLSRRKQLALSVQLIDARHKPTTMDRQLYEWLTAARKRNIIVATKADKLSSNQLKKSLESISVELPGSTVITFSSTSGKGRERLWRLIAAEVEDFGK